MTVELYPYEPPPGVELITTWLRAVGIPAAAERPPGAALPFYVVSYAAGTDDKITDHGIYSVHSFAQTYTAAEDAARLAHRRMLALAPPYVPQRRVALGDGRVVWADQVATDQKPREEFYSDTIKRFIGRYRVDLRFVAAA